MKAQSDISSQGILIWLIGMNTALLVASNAGGAKMINLPFGFAASATVFSYAMSFAFTDTISELFGPSRARQAVIIGFVGLILSVAFFQISIHAPPAEGWGNQSAYQLTLGHSFRLLLGGWTSYAISQNLDVWIFHKVREKTQARHLWLRNNVSTAVSQFIDTCIFITVAFYGVFPIWNAILGQYLLKLIIAAIDTPLVYLAVTLISRKSKVHNIK